MKRIGLLTSGGDCPGLNAALRGVAKALFDSPEEVEIYGIRDGYAGLIEDNVHRMMPADFSGILTLGGTVLGTSRRPFKEMRVVGEDRIDKVAAMKTTVARRRLDALVILGGNGTHKTANLLREEGIPVVTLPKTIDNDLWGTDVTFGFHTAVDTATTVLDSLHSTATSHGRIFLVELMGHKAGWLTLYAGIAGGADGILLPEIPYDLEAILRMLARRRRQGKAFSILAVAEGALSREEAAMSKKERTAVWQRQGVLSAAARLAKRLEEQETGEIRICIPGHFQRGGSPCPYDRVLATRLGVEAAQLIRAGRFGCMCAMVNGQVKAVPLEEVAGKLKLVPVDDSLVEQAKAIGVSFGDSVQKI